MVEPERDSLTTSLAGRPRLVAVAAALALAGPILLVACGDATDTAAPTTTAVPRRHVRPLPPNSIRIHWKKRALLRARRPGRICIVTVKTGHFCASYQVGEIPAKALRLKLLEHGFIPVTV